MPGQPVDPGLALHQMMDQAEAGEDIQTAFGTRNGRPWFIMVAMGANVGIVKKGLYGNGLKLQEETKNDVRTFDAP